MTQVAPRCACRLDLADKVGYAYEIRCLDALFTAAQSLGGTGEACGAALDEAPPLAVILAHDDHVLSTPVNAGALPYLSPDLKLAVVLGANHCVRGLCDTLLFDSFEAWRGLGEHRLKVDESLRSRLLAKLGPAACVHDEYHAREHSIETLLPLLSRRAPGCALLPIGVPRLSDAPGVAGRLAEELREALKERGLALGRDVLFVLSNDCCHYGGDFDFAPHGADEAGHRRMCEVDRAIVDDSFVGAVSEAKVARFLERTSNPDPEKRRQVDSLWCGTYPITLGLYTLLRLLPEGAGLRGRAFGLSNSMDTPPLQAAPHHEGGPCPVAMTCPPPSYNHWVGHLSAGFFQA